MSEPSCQGSRERDQVIAALLQRVADLEAAVRELQAKLNRNSANSSTPPSADPLDAPPQPAKKPSSGKPGGQTGHQAFRPTRLPPERVTTVVSFVPAHCGHCSAPLPANSQPGDPEPSWHQVVDLPPVTANVVEYQGHYRTCPCCSHVSHAAIATGVKAHCSGQDWPPSVPTCAASRSVCEVAPIVQTKKIPSLSGICGMSP